MKLFSSELGSNYDTYTFGYTNYALREASDSLTAIYEKGFLPYSGSREVRNVFYMARSARVVLSQFSQTSENRRIAKKFDGVFTKKRIERKDFIADESFYTFCLTYFAAQHGAVMPRERLVHIMECALITHVIEYQKGEDKAAYVLEVETENMAHYWFSFYALEYAKQSLGLWLMQDAVLHAKQRGLSHYYLGTVYGEKALYKTNFEPLEWWNGAVWNTDVKILKEHGRRDGDRVLSLTDEWKDTSLLF